MFHAKRFYSDTRIQEHTTDRAYFPHHQHNIGEPAGINTCHQIVKRHLGTTDIESADEMQYFRILMNALHSTFQTWENIRNGANLHSNQEKFNRHTHAHAAKGYRRN